MSSYACLVESGLKFIFQWNDHSPIFFKLILRSIFETSTFLTTEKCEVFSANNLEFDAKFSDKLLRLKATVAQEVNFRVHQPQI